MTDRSPEITADVLAPLAGLEIQRGSRGQLILGRPARLGPGRVGGELVLNDMWEPDWRTNGERTMFDAFPTAFEVHYTGGDEDIRLAEARVLFGELSAAPLVLALIRSVDFLIAISHPRTGVVAMPEGTSPFEDQRDLWLPYLLGAPG
ncbi:hypothetical protein [Actinoplanes sp. NBRC 103695]|uniref:hypothetical protein n=1 Tax=Actinoplanes sp. NBRC 103695 TaxID=3032202 RepID=UPI0025537F87|nr:hypothetical protein [Actinoplanes sp. NBRC 103695]